MILLIVEKKIHKYIADYLHHLKDYIMGRFKKNVEIITYVNPPKITVTKYQTAIFIQKINPTIFNALKGSCKKYILNIEQMTVDSYVKPLTADIKKYKVDIIDYSLENIIILRKMFPDRKVLFFPFPITIKPTVEKTTPAITLLSSARRRQIAGTIKTPMVNFNGKWEAARDKMIAESKVLVNIHHTNTYAIFESIRCYHALELRTLVVSETSDKCANILLADYIIFTPANKLNETVAKVLANYEEYYERMFSPARIEELEMRLYQTFESTLKEIESNLEFQIPQPTPLQPTPQPTLPPQSPSPTLLPQPTPPQSTLLSQPTPPQSTPPTPQPTPQPQPSLPTITTQSPKQSSTSKPINKAKPNYSLNKKNSGSSSNTMPKKYTNAKRAQVGGSQVEIPTVKWINDTCKVGGYQRFTIDNDNITVDGNYKAKFAYIRSFLKEYLEQGAETVSDIGASNGLVSFMAAKEGYPTVYALDHDRECIKTINKVKDKCKFAGAVTAKEYSFGDDTHPQTDIVIVGALIHWIYSCTSLYGNFDEIISYLRNLTGKVLLIEWVNPSDPAIKSFKHIEFNKNVIKEPYTKENFLASLEKHFDKVDKVHQVTATRELYLCHLCHL